MPSKHKLFFVINYLLCGVARLAIHIFPLAYLKRYFGPYYKITVLSTLISNQQRSQALLISKSVKLAANYTPWKSNCLTQAMVAKFWCRQYKIPYILYIGFMKAVDEPGGYMGHAWTTAGDVFITGGDGLANYHVISSFVYLGDNALLPLSSI